MATETMRSVDYDKATSNPSLSCHHLFHRLEKRQDRRDRTQLRSTERRKRPIISPSRRAWSITILPLAATKKTSFYVTPHPTQRVHFFIRLYDSRAVDHDQHFRKRPSRRNQCKAHLASVDASIPSRAMRQQVHPCPLLKGK